MRHALGLLGMVLAIGGAPVGASLGAQTVGAGASAGHAARAEALLSRLEGRWQMVGVVQGDSVKYTLEAERALDHRFVVLRMRDEQIPPRYEAHVYVGVDSARVIAHWMDVFGAGSSIPHATGAVVRDTLTLHFAYASGDFRDILTYDRARDTWRFLLESADGRGGWTRFAEYRVRRR